MRKEWSHLGSASSVAGTALVASTCADCPNTRTPALAHGAGSRGPSPNNSDALWPEKQSGQCAPRDHADKDPGHACCSGPLQALQAGGRASAPVPDGCTSHSGLFIKILVKK